MTELRAFEGHDVIAAKAKITNAGDGLSASLQLDPDEYPLGARVRLVLDTTVTRVAYEPVKGAEGSLSRVHTLKTELVVVAEGEDIVQKLLDAQRERLDEAAGRAPIGLDDVDHEPERAARRRSRRAQEGKEGGDD